MKPVNQNCCSKKILVRTLKNEWGERILVGCSTANDNNVYWCVCVGYEEEFIENTESVKIIGWDESKRCSDVIYGDEDE